MDLEGVVTGTAFEDIVAASTVNSVVTAGAHEVVLAISAVQRDAGYRLGNVIDIQADSLGVGIAVRVGNRDFDIVRLGRFEINRCAWFDQHLIPDHFEETRWVVFQVIGEGIADILVFGREVCNDGSAGSVFLDGASVYHYFCWCFVDVGDIDSNGFCEAVACRVSHLDGHLMLWAGLEIQTCIWLQYQLVTVDREQS